MAAEPGEQHYRNSKKINFSGGCVMKHFLLRNFWWINYITKFVFLLFAVAVVCMLSENTAGYRYGEAFGVR